MFDPYHKWLGIPPEDQPPNHYRLLAVNLFESDADVIDAAADRQMTYVRGCANGPYVAESQKLLNELSAARVCLLTPQKKSAYDQALKTKQPATENHELGSIDLADYELPSPKKKKRKSSRKKLPLMTMVPIGVVLLAVVYGIVSMFSQPRSVALLSPEPTANAVVSPVTAKPDGPTSSPEATDAQPRAAPATIETASSPFQQWTNAVAAMSADSQVDAVRKKLLELNPKFDGLLTPKIEAGVVTEIKVVTDLVSDISPIQALRGLKFLDCSSSGNASNFQDLSPLKGMSLVKLHANTTMVNDVSALCKMPLTSLSIANTPVSDLTALQGLRLVTLDCAGSRVSDLSPLMGMRLGSLSIQSSQVSDLSPLKGMPLKLLNLERTQVSDLSPLKGMPLEILGCPYTKVSDLSPLTGMSLKHLYCNDTPISDLSPLQNMSLQRISVTPKNIRVGIDVLRSMKSLENISSVWDWENKSPPDEFWKRYDAGGFK